MELMFAKSPPSTPQLDMFDGRVRQQAAATASPPDNQDTNIRRVRARISALIVEFARRRIDGGRREFHVDDLRKYVLREIPTAPDSAGRILRDLRQRKQLDYEIVSRRDSHYRLLWVAP